MTSRRRIDDQEIGSDSRTRLNLKLQKSWGALRVCSAPADAGRDWLIEIGESFFHTSEVVDPNAPPMQPLEASDCIGRRTLGTQTIR